MAALSSPLRVCRGILKELRAIQGPSYKKSLAYNYVMDQFRKNKLLEILKGGGTHTQTDESIPVYHKAAIFYADSRVTGERYCRAKQEAHHASHTYLCLLASTRNHLVLHNLYHGKGERSPEEVASLVGLRLPTQPGGKGWEK